MLKHDYNEKLSNLVMNICLQYPFWNDFRILDFFRKRGLGMTMAELKELRSLCGIRSREELCQELMWLHFNHEIMLGKKQVQFIERLNPAFRDRNFKANRPGELLVYECVFFRRFNRMFYLHLVVDLFNGHAFGRVSHHCSGDIAFKLLQEKIIPMYRSRGYKVKSIAHSIRATREHCGIEEATIGEQLLGLGIEWLEPNHEFGIIQRFQRDVLEGFFNHAEDFAISLAMIQPAFDRWMIKYNGGCPFHQRRNFLGYIGELDNQENELLVAESR